jgi:hypothetical protein
VTNQELEEWFVFDMVSEHVDPRFLHWLAQHGITAKVNAAGLRGLIANAHSALPAYLVDKPDDQAITVMIPFSLKIGSSELFPNFGECLDSHDSINGKPKRFKSNPLDFNYGRPTRKILIEYLVNTLAIAVESMERIEECDRIGLREEFSEQIKLISSHIKELELVLRNENVE